MKSWEKAENIYHPLLESRCIAAQVSNGRKSKTVSYGETVFPTGKLILFSTKEARDKFLQNKKREETL